METDVSLQAAGLGAGLLLGLALGFAYDLLRVLRRRFPSRAVGILLDLLFWAGVCRALVELTLHAGNGTVSLYHAAVIAGGCFLYLQILSPLVLPVCMAGAELVAKIWKIVTAPFIFLWTRTKKFCKICKKYFHYWMKWIIVRVRIRRRVPHRPGPDKKRRHRS